MLYVSESVYILYVSENIYMLYVSESIYYLRAYIYTVCI